MGDRYILEIVCPKCGDIDNNVYFAPTCGFEDWMCKCGFNVDLYSYTGITYEDASNITIIEGIVKAQQPKAETPDAPKP